MKGNSALAKKPKAKKKKAAKPRGRKSRELTVLEQMNHRVGDISDDLSWIRSQLTAEVKERNDSDKLKEITRAVSACPVCDSGQLVHTINPIDDVALIVGVECQACEHRYQLQYKLAGWSSSE